MPTLPSLFVSHGAPTLLLEGGATVEFLSGLGATLPRPQAILCISAHWDLAQPRVSAAPRPETIHDFYGFPEALYRMRYPAPGAPALAARTLALLGEAGIACAADPDRGLDHGAWVPLARLYPDADIPVTQLSVSSSRDMRWHVALGAALAALRVEGVLILASGGATHNLREFGRYRLEDPPPAYVEEFDAWLEETVAAGDVQGLCNYREYAPHAARNQPTEEHFVPLAVAMGAGSGGGRRLHAGHTWGVLSMAAWAFD